MHIDALDGAAALAGIEHGAVDQVLDRMGEIGIGADIGRILAAEFQAEAHELAEGRLLHGMAAGRPSR